MKMTRCCIRCVVTWLYVIRLTRRTLEREGVAVAPCVEKMVETRLRWFGHVERKFVNFVVTGID